MFITHTVAVVKATQIYEQSEQRTACICKPEIYV